jgi:hypothetical protein
MLAVVSLGLAACGPVPRHIVHTEMSAPVVVGDSLVMSATTRTFGRDDDRFLVRCPLSTLARPRADCEWYPITEAAPRSEAERQRFDAATQAGVDHGCAPPSMIVQSGSPAEGFWIAGCDHQWFYRLSDGHWTDVTPSP